MHENFWHHACAYTRISPASEVSLTLMTGGSNIFSACTINYYVQAIQCSGRKISIFCAPWQAPHVVKMAI